MEMRYFHEYLKNEDRSRHGEVGGGVWRAKRQTPSASLLGGSGGEGAWVRLGLSAANYWSWAPRALSFS
jgi:hypothetical protein